MDYTPIAPFMRPISRAHLRVVERPEASVPGKPVNKWELFRELSKAQAAFGVSERDLTILQGLLSFFPDDALGGGGEGGGCLRGKRLGCALAGGQNQGGG